MINRMFVIGVLTDRQNIGTDTEPLWRALVSDGTDKFYVYAGKYAPEAAQILSKTEPPTFVAIIGKSRTYSPQEGTMYMSVRPEKIVRVTDKIRDNWIAETARSTLHRIDAIEDAKEMGEPSVEELVKLGYGKVLAEGVVKCIPHYTDLDLNRYRGMVIEVLEQLLPERFPESSVPHDLPLGPEEIEDDEEVAVDAKGEDKEETVLNLIDKLDKGGKGAPLAELNKRS